MFPYNFWRRLLRVGVYTLLTYLAIGYIVFGATIIRWEISLLPSQPVTTPVAKESNNYGILNTRIRNVFGDPVPYAVIHINNQLVQADNEGRVNLAGILPGRYRMEIFAGGYHPYEWEIQIEPGTNSPVIKYESGLWPSDFAVDFHVFFFEDSTVFGTVGFANGTDEPLYIHRAVIYNPAGEEELELLQENDGMDYYNNLASKLAIINEPQPALKLPANSWITGELPPLDGPMEFGEYVLEVQYAPLKEHRQNNYRIHRVTDELEEDGNWDPHL